jgi:hypothetical protein
MMKLEVELVWSTVGICFDFVMFDFVVVDGCCDFLDVLELVYKHWQRLLRQRPFNILV